MTNIKQWILDIIKKRGPLSDRDIKTLAEWYGIAYSPSGLRTRRKELVDAGLVRASDQRQKLLTGYHARLWEIDNATVR